MSRRRKGAMAWGYNGAMARRPRAAMVVVSNEMQLVKTRYEWRDVIGEGDGRSKGSMRKVSLEFERPRRRRRVSVGHGISKVANTGTLL
ncbi:hypothetical protein U1Q18_010680 [Sarracenia purpurea var. burkii]